MDSPRNRRHGSTRPSPRSFIAKKAYAADPISSTALGWVAYRTNATPEQALCLSADGLRQPYPAIDSPSLAFKTNFGGAAGPQPGTIDDNLASTLATGTAASSISPTRTSSVAAPAIDAGKGALDNSLVVFINCCGGVHHRGHERHPLIMVAGKNVGMRGGRYITHLEGKYCISDAYTSIANLFLDTKDQLQTFGDPKVCKGPLPALV